MTRFNTDKFESFQRVPIRRRFTQASE